MTTTTLVFPDFLSVSPFGPYCKECSIPLAVEKGIYSHRREAHPSVSFKNALVVREVKRQMAELRQNHSRDFSPFLVSNSLAKEMWFCAGCFVAFGKFSNFKRHFESRCNKECVFVDDKKTFCYETICGRMGPKTCPQEQRPAGPIESLILVSAEGTTISSLSQSKSSYKTAIISCDSSKVPAALMTTIEEAKEILKPFVRPDEDVKDLCLIFYPLLSRGFEGTIRQYLEFASKGQVEDPILTKWLEAGKVWMTNYASGHIANVSANVRHRLAEFESQEVDGTTYGTRTFTLRRGIPRLIAELEAALRFFYRYRTSLFDQFKHDEIGKADITWMIERAIIPRILYIAAKEEPTDHGQLPIACRYCLSRGFTLKNKVNLVMYECGWFSSRISALMHLLRAGVCGYLVTLSVEESQDLTNLELDVVKSVQNGRVTNLLAPYVKRLRDLNARKPPIKDNTVNANGDITSGAFIFPMTVWSTLIPRLTRLAKTYFAQVFVGSSWEYFFTLPIRVADWVGLDASVENGDVKIFLKSLILKENSESVLAQLQSLAEFCLLGLGVGAVRHGEVTRLTVRSFKWHNSYLYYWSESLKQGSLKGDKTPRLIEHRLSLSLSRVFLLTRYAFVASGCVESDAFMPAFAGASMLALVRDIFDLDSIPHMLNIRHFFTSIGNILLPDHNSDSTEGTVVSNVSLTEKSGHTQGTGRRAYATYLENSVEALYDMYHKSLGEVSLDPPVVRFTPFSDSLLATALKELLGANAEFRSRHQKLMVEIAANSITKHSYVGMPCGHGKSLSWFVPVMASYLAGRQVGLRIVILPYKFLLGHMVQQARFLFGLLGDRLCVEFLDSADIDEQSIKSLLFGSNVPSILFINLDGASLLLREHMATLQKLARTNILKRVYVDEFQQLIVEFGFRSAYTTLRDLGRIGVPVMCLSGSMPLSIATSLMSYCNLMLGDQVESIDLVQGTDPIGDGFYFDVRIVVNVETSIAKFVLGSTNAACHIICDTKALVENVVNKLSNHCNVLSVTGDTPSHEQMKCAEEWSKGTHDVLVSTVVALVGNENKKCRHIIVGGFLYNVSSLVQAIGRLRPDQRGPSSTVTVFRSGFGSKSREDAKTTERNSFSELVHASCLKDESLDDYSKVFSPVGLQTVLGLKDGCYVQSLSQFYGFARSPCENCSLCLKVETASTKASIVSPPSTVPMNPYKRLKATAKDIPVANKGIIPPVVENHVLSMMSQCVEMSAEERNIRRMADSVFRELLYRCIDCGKAHCNGECARGCYRCGDPNHRMNVCIYDSKKLGTILPNKGVCFGCYDTQMHGMETHDMKSCPLQRRLKRLVHMDRAKSMAPYDSYLRRLYTDELTFLKMIASFSGRVTLGRTCDRQRLDVQRLHCTQVAHDDPSAPLLPPDMIHQSKDLSVDGLVRSVVFKDVDAARAKYQSLSLEKSSVRRRRKFVFGSMYRKLFKGYFELDPTQSNIDLQVDCRPGVSSVLMIRLVSPDDGLGKDNLLRAGIALGRALGNRGNARGSKVGDIGSMHALGYRCALKRELYVMDETICDLVEHVSRPMRDWMEDHMQEALKDMIAADRRTNVAYTLSCMPTGPGSRMMVSVNLANAAHLDVDDTSVSVAMWLEERPGVATNWYFILPNVSYQGSTGVVVKLCHGTVIAWDAREIFHCTSKTNVGDDNRVYGCMWGASN